MTFRDKLETRFVVTSELTPPKGTNLDELLSTASVLKDCVDAINLTDSHSALMSTSPLAAAHLLIDEGVEPILQLVTRDRNRIALQSDMLGAYVLGVRNLVCMGGDPPTVGDHPNAKPVFDLVTTELINAAGCLNDGVDLAGCKLKAPTDFCIGAVVNPGASELAAEITRMEAKVAAGARFFQTQAVYDIATFEEFLRGVEHLNVAIIAGVMPIKSVKMARYANEKIPGIAIPEALSRQIDQADDVAATSIRLAAETVAALESLCAGVHLMMLGAELRIPRIL
ncbi:MAG: methylenetetrahydrofolate reductase, partial [Gammaproteobacteria bacterium]|nr:methylenetetrahydrofolate reductase [Gammaproteobacteria bacterium]